MKQVNVQECELHVIVCSNERPAEKASCKPVGGEDFYFKLKQKLKDEKLNDRIWATRSGCLGFCNTVGCAVAIYRRGTEPKWFSEVTPSDFDTIWNEITH